MEKPADDYSDIVPQPQGNLSEKDLSFLLDEVRVLFELTPEQNVYKFMADSLSRFLNDAVVIVNSFNEPADTLQVSAISGLGSFTEKIVSLLGNHPVNLSVPMNDDARTGLTGSTLTIVPGGIYVLATGSIPQIVCSSIENILNIRLTYAMGITWRDTIIGSVAILARHEITSLATVETFVNFAATVIQRQLVGKH